MKFSLADENKNLRLKLSQELDKYNQQKKYLTDQIIDLENKVSDLEFLNAEQSINLKALEEELINKSCGYKQTDGLNPKPKSQLCFALHTGSINGINDYISLLGKAKDDVINFKKESSRLRSELDQYKKKLAAKNGEIEKLKADLEYVTNAEVANRKICICHDVDSNYESYDDSKSDDQFESKTNYTESPRDGVSKSNRINYKSKSISEKSCSNVRKTATDAAVQVNNIEHIMRSNLDEYIRKAKNIIPDYDSCENKTINKIQNERDYYCREYHLLRDKVLNIFGTSDRHYSSECPFSLLDRMKSELRRQAVELEQIKKSYDSNNDVPQNYNGSRNNLEDRIRRLESKESDLLSVNEKLALKVRKLEDQCHGYCERIQVLNKESNKQKSLYSQIRKMQDDSERSLFNVQDALRKCDSELSCALSKINHLEDDNRKLKKDMSIIENEKKCLKKNLVHLDHEKDNLGIKLDEKTELVVRLEKELRGKNKYVSELEKRISKLEESLKILQNINMKIEGNVQCTNKNYSAMQKELRDLQKGKEDIIFENRRLQDNLSAAVRDCFQSNNELQASKTEVEELKTRLQSYVSEVRRIEDILQIKEDERRCMLEQLKGLNVEYSNNVSRSRTSDNMPLDNITDFQSRYLDFSDDILGGR